MSDQPIELIGLDRIRHRFIGLLDDQKAHIAYHTMAAWDGQDAALVNGHLEAAREILHRIAGTAGTVGLPELGTLAQHCEIQITRYLEGAYADLGICPGEIMWTADRFMEHRLPDARAA